MTPKSLQEKYAPGSICFGCGPSNPQGLKIRSIAPESGRSPKFDDEVTVDWHPSRHHEAFPGMLNGGIIGSLLDCHCNWTAAWHLMRLRGSDHPPCTVTAEYSIKLLRPTPSDGPVHLTAHVTESSGNRVNVEGTLSSHGKVCATCRGVFVAVEPGHPAYHRW